MNKSESKNKMNDVPKKDELYPLLEMEAKAKGLNIYLFENEELKEYFNPNNEILEAIVLSKNESGARWNLRNLRRVYLVRKE